MENTPTNRGKMSNKRCIKAKLQYLQREPPVLFYLSGFPGSLAWFSFQMFCLNNKILFSLANANNSASFKRKNVEKSPVLLIHKQQTDLWIKLPSGQDRKKPPALGTNQIARFGGFRPLASSENNNVQYSLSSTLCTGSCTKLEMVNGTLKLTMNL